MVKRELLSQLINPQWKSFARSCQISRSAAVEQNYFSGNRQPRERGTDSQLNPNYIISLQKVWGDGICWADILSGNLEMFLCFCDDDDCDDDFCDDD